MELIILDDQIHEIDEFWNQVQIASPLFYTLISLHHYGLFWSDYFKTRKLFFSLN